MEPAKKKARVGSESRQTADYWQNPKTTDKMGVLTKKLDMEKIGWLGISGLGTSDRQF